MPRCVRNFWLDLSVDGKKTDVGTGPRSRDGGFDLTIKQRDDGCVSDAVDIIGRAMSDGRLVLTITRGGEVLFELGTCR